MIRGEFFVRGDSLCGFRISGHSGSAPAGSDIVCAAVSSAAYLTANAVTDVLHAEAEVSADPEGTLSVSVPEAEQERCRVVLEALLLHLGQLSQQYPKNLQVFQIKE